MPERMSRNNRQRVCTMSYIGLDIGTSAVKAVAYDAAGRSLASARVPVARKNPQPGWDELNPDEVWQAVCAAVGSLAAAPAVKADPPLSLAVSASGEEVFPVDEAGRVLAPCILSSDRRGADIERKTAQHRSPQAWLSACGHVPQRMDPVNRILWLRFHQPSVFQQTTRLVGWHEFGTLRLTGQAVTDPSLAAKWAAFDLGTNAWSPERLIEFDLDEAMLPVIEQWGGVAGQITAAAARETGLPRGMNVGVGAFDAICSALGAGVGHTGITALSCGSWQVLVAPASRPWLSDGNPDAPFSIIPSPGHEPFAILSKSPNGSAVAEWVSNLVGLSLDEAGASFGAASPEPGHVLAIPHLSGALALGPEGQDSRGGLVGLTLATKPLDIVRAFMESIAYELALTVGSLRRLGVPMTVLRATGGGTRSAWWMQLKSDMTGLPIEVVEHAEPGTWGAALLARYAAEPGLGPQTGIETVPQIARRYEPDLKRRAMHQARLELYHDVVGTLLAKMPRATP